jgi:hypothetical protein
MTVRILDEAASELEDAIDRYESIEPGLGIRLKNEARTVLTWIEDHFEMPRIRKNGYRRVNLKIFPYYISYIISGETVWILAFAHAARLPDYWIKRRGKR